MSIASTPWRRALLAGVATLTLAAPAFATTIYSGSLSIASTDPTQLGRLNRAGVPQSWAAGEAFPTWVNTTTSYHYRTLDLDLAALETGFQFGQYLQVTIDSSVVTTFLAGYLNSYNPANGTTAQSTWLGDAGLSGLSFGTDPQTFQVSVASGNHLLLVLNETTPNGGLAQPANIIVEAFSDTQYTDLASAVPEPGTWALMAGGIAVLVLRRRRA